MQVPPASIVFPEEDIADALRMIEGSLRSGLLTLGKHGQALEETFAARCGRRYGVAVSSGTSALEIALRILGAEGREVIVPDNTFFATAAAVVHAGGRPVFADVEKDTLALSAESVRARLTPRTAGVVLVHIGGIVTPAIRELERLCRERGLFLLCDAAHAHGATLDGVDASAWGIASTYSFYPTKVMTSGEGGMIVTDDESLAAEARVYRDQGKGSFTANFHTRLGANWRLSEVHAALGLVQLRRLDEFIARRREIAAVYLDALRDDPVLTFPAGQRIGESNFYKFVGYLPAGVDRAATRQVLRNEFEVGLSGEVYDLPLHEQPVFAKFVQGHDYPGAAEVCGRHVCLPVSARMTPAEARYVVDSLARVVPLGAMR